MKEDKRVCTSGKAEEDRGPQVVFFPPLLSE